MLRANSQGHARHAVRARRAGVFVVRRYHSRWRRPAVDRHRVGARHEIRERVAPVGARHRRPRHRTALIVGAGQRDCQPRNPVLASVLSAVRILVEPNTVADRAERAEVPVVARADSRSQACRDRRRIRAFHLHPARRHHRSELRIRLAHIRGRQSRRHHRRPVPARIGHHRLGSSIGIQNHDVHIRQVQFVVGAPHDVVQTIQILRPVPVTVVIHMPRHRA